MKLATIFGFLTYCTSFFKMLGVIMSSCSYGCSAIIDAAGNRRNANLNDYIQLIKLVQQSDGFRFNGGIRYPNYGRGRNLARNYVPTPLNKDD